MIPVLIHTESAATAVHKSGGTDLLLKLTKSDDDNVQCMAARALKNICETGNTRLSQALMLIR